MPRLPRLTSRLLLMALKRAGFYIHHQSGSHINLRHKVKSHLHVVIPARRKTLALKTLKSILVQTEITAKELKELL